MEMKEMVEDKKLIKILPQAGKVKMEPREASWVKIDPVNKWWVI
jgi:uncharacterized ubiquitin-like protein YukD